MAFRDPNSFDTIPRIRTANTGVVNQVGFELELPEDHSYIIPDDAQKFLTDLGWMPYYSAQLKQTLFTHNQWEGYFHWHEAVSMEYIRFMRIGAVEGDRKQDMSGTATESPARFG